jgi:hypothetical protein
LRSSAETPDEVLSLSITPATVGCAGLKQGASPLLLTDLEHTPQPFALHTSEAADGVSTASAAAPKATSDGDDAVSGVQHSIPSSAGDPSVAM